MSASLALTLSFHCGRQVAQIGNCGERWRSGGVRMPKRMGSGPRDALPEWSSPGAVSYTHLRAHETSAHL
eukprot:4537136-Alexandrium_andersonii.AAC.1